LPNKEISIEDQYLKKKVNYYFYFEMGSDLCYGDKMDESLIEIKSTTSREKNVEIRSISHIEDEKFRKYIRDSLDFKQDYEVDLDKSTSVINIHVKKT
jgi:hypothetical protein